MLLFLVISPLKGLESRINWIVCENIGKDTEWNGNVETH